MGSLDQKRYDAIQKAFGERQWPKAFAALRSWFDHYRQELSLFPTRERARRLLLWQSLADVAEASSDQRLLESFWQLVDRLPPPPPPPQDIPLLGVPILNGERLLGRLLDSLDQTVHTLAIVDNSAGDPAVTGYLQNLQANGHPRIGHICISRPFRNIGVAASWNQILTAFPELPWALIVNHDVVFAAGVLRQVIDSVDSSRAQWISLLPGAAAYSAFVITSQAWDRVGLFSEDFFPAYWEDNDYRNRLDADPSVEQFDRGAWLPAMLASNPTQSATLAADPALAEANRFSFQLNRLWYYSHRRLKGGRQGLWRRRWLASWD